MSYNDDDYNDGYGNNFDDDGPPDSDFYSDNNDPYPPDDDRDYENDKQHRQNFADQYQYEREEKDRENLADQQQKKDEERRQAEKEERFRRQQDAADSEKQANEYTENSSPPPFEDDRNFGQLNAFNGPEKNSGGSSGTGKGGGGSGPSRQYDPYYEQPQYQEDAWRSRTPPDLKSDLVNSITNAGQVMVNEALKPMKNSVGELQTVLQGAQNSMVATAAKNAARAAISESFRKNAEDIMLDAGVSRIQEIRKQNLTEPEYDKMIRACYNDLGQSVADELSELDLTERLTSDPDSVFGVFSNRDRKEYLQLGKELNEILPAELKSEGKDIAPSVLESLQTNSQYSKQIQAKAQKYEQIKKRFHEKEQQVFRRGKVPDKYLKMVEKNSKISPAAKAKARAKRRLDRLGYKPNHQAGIKPRTWHPIGNWNNIMMLGDRDGYYSQFAKLFKQYRTIAKRTYLFAYRTMMRAGTGFQIVSNSVTSLYRSVQQNRILIAKKKQAAGEVLKNRQKKLLKKEPEINKRHAKQNIQKNKRMFRRNRRKKRQGRFTERWSKIRHPFHTLSSRFFKKTLGKLMFFRKAGRFLAKAKAIFAVAGKYILIGLALLAFLLILIVIISSIVGMDASNDKNANYIIDEYIDDYKNWQEEISDTASNSDGEVKIKFDHIGSEKYYKEAKTSDNQTEEMGGKYHCNIREVYTVVRTYFNENPAYGDLDSVDKSTIQRVTRAYFDASHKISTINTGTDSDDITILATQYYYNDIFDAIKNAEVDNFYDSYHIIGDKFASAFGYGMNSSDVKAGTDDSSGTDKQEALNNKVYHGQKNYISSGSGTHSWKDNDTVTTVGPTGRLGYLSYDKIIRKSRLSNLADQYSKNLAVGKKTYRQSIVLLGSFKDAKGKENTKKAKAYVEEISKIAKAHSNVDFSIVSVFPTGSSNETETAADSSSKTNNKIKKYNKALSAACTSAGNVRYVDLYSWANSHGCLFEGIYDNYSLERSLYLQLRQKVQQQEEDWSGMAKITGGNTSDIAYATFRSLGFTHEAACGILGNIQQESGFRADYDSYNGSEGYEGYSMFSITDDRAAAMRRYCISKYHNPYSAQGQAEYMAREMAAQLKIYSGRSPHYYSNGEWCWWPKKVTLAQFKKLTSASEAAEIFERCCERASIPRMSKRKSYANGAAIKYAKYKDNPQALVNKLSKT